MEADCSGWATKANVLCADGRTIKPNAFRDQHRKRVPLVWQHGHKDPDNVLGHAILENRGEEGVYAYCFFNKNKKSQAMKEAVNHMDITQMSVWANRLVERSKQVFHGTIQEVSLVISGANPEAVIENVYLAHADGDVEDIEGNIVIFSGLELMHGNGDGDLDALLDVEDEDSEANGNNSDNTENNDANENGADKEGEMDKEVQHADEEGPTIQDIYDGMTEEQQLATQYMVGAALESVAHSDDIEDIEDNDAGDGKEGKTLMHTNVFEEAGKEGNASDKAVLSHDDMKEIVELAKREGGSLKAGIDEYGLKHGIDDIDNLFPEVTNISDTPEWRMRRVEWVNVLLGGVKKSPFSHIKTLGGDLTFPQARAKGYIKGTMKREEFVKTSKRITRPCTVYKKQKLDRDDIIDITDFDVVVWIKGEMRVMLDEEIARQILVGDGRDSDDEDKIDDECIRPILTDSELFVTTISVNISDANSSTQEIVDAIVRHRWEYRGTGQPILFTSETYIARFLLLKDTTGRDLYTSLEELAAKLRVSAIVPVELLHEEAYADVVCILVNPVDYTMGASKGGEVNLFDFFDIDYNQQKYLIETRCCGALTKFKSALVVKKVDAEVEVVVPNAPTFDEDSGVITIVATTGVIYKDAEDNVLMTGAQAAIDEGDEFIVYASADDGYALEDSDASWAFVRPYET